MPVIKLNRIKLENFKGLKSFEANLGGNNALIRAENGVGKTTIYDAFLWGLFGKDSVGRSDFGIRPLDGNNQPIKGLVVAVEMELQVNGTIHTLRKEQHENVVKGQLRGFQVVCTIDEVPKKVGEYQGWVRDLIPEDMFKMMTDLSYFCSQMKWTDRRKVLLDIAGQVSEPAGFEGLVEMMKGRTIDEAEEVLKSQKKAHVKERDQINPRIDELQLGLDAYAQTKGDNKEELQATRKSLNEKIDGLDKQRGDLLAEVKSKQVLTEKINHLTCERGQRESIVKNQQGTLEVLTDERMKLEQDHADKSLELVSLQSIVQETNRAIESSQSQVDILLESRKSIGEAYNKAKNLSDNSVQIQAITHARDCDLANPALRDMADTFLLNTDEIQTSALAKIEARGNSIKQAIDETKAKKAEQDDELNKLIAKEEAMVDELKAAEAVKNNRIEEINKAIADRPEPDPAKDAKWLEITEKITELQAQIGEPVSEQLTGIEAERKLANELLTKINEALAQVDNIAKSRARIAELEDREKELAQKIADIEGQLDEIDRFKAEQNKLVEAAVNGLFQHITFKLFDYYLNEGYKPCCVAILNGVPYPDMSFGQKIYCGTDGINTLSDHYGVECPLFLDHSESFTMPIEAESQVIRLKAVKGVTELQVEVEEAKAVETA